jgi:hypothetical protein
MRFELGAQSIEVTILSCYRAEVEKGTHQAREFLDKSNEKCTSESVSVGVQSRPLRERI